MDKNVYDTLIRRSAVIQGKYRVVKYLFFSLNGYSDWFQSLPDSDVLLFTLEDLYR